MMMFTTVPALIAKEEIDCLIRFWANGVNDSANGKGNYLVLDAMDRLKEMVELRATIAAAPYAPGASQGTKD